MADKDQAEKIQDCGARRRQYRVAGVSLAAGGVVMLMLGPQRALGVVGIAFGVIVAVDEVLAAQGVASRGRTAVKAILSALTLCFVGAWLALLRR